MEVETYPKIKNVEKLVEVKKEEKIVVSSGCQRIRI
jgi:hypothetical protein